MFSRNRGLDTGGFKYRKGAFSLPVPFLKLNPKTLQSIILVNQRDTAATLIDHENIVRTAKPGEVRIERARRVENILPNTEHDSGATGKGTTPPVVNGLAVQDGRNCIEAIFPSGVTGYTVSRMSGTLFNGNEIGKTYVASGLLKISRRLTTGESLTIYVTGANGLSIFTVTSLNSSSFLSFSHYAGGASTATGATGGALSFTIFPSGLTSPLTVWSTNRQLENVTNQSDQTSSEYVSNGVLVFPYHKAGADGVKYFYTKKNGEKIISVPYILNERQSTNIYPNSEGGLAAYTSKSGGVDIQGQTNGLTGFVEYDNSITSTTRYSYKGITLNIGENYVLSFFVKSDNDIVVSKTTASGSCCIVSGGSLVQYNKVEHERLSSTLVRYKVYFTSINTGGGVGVVQYPSQKEKFSFTGMQLEQGSICSSYIRTMPSLTYTRNADTLKHSFGSGNLPQEFCYYADIEPLIDSTTDTSDKYGLFGTSGSSGIKTNGANISSITGNNFSLSRSSFTEKIRMRVGIQVSSNKKEEWINGVNKVRLYESLTSHSESGELEIGNSNGVVMPMKIYDITMYPPLEEKTIRKVTHIGEYDYH